MRKIRNAIQDDIEYENRSATISAINRIDTPIDRGLTIKSRFKAKDVIIRDKIKVIYKYEACTHLWVLYLI